MKLMVPFLFLFISCKDYNPTPLELKLAAEEEEYYYYTSLDSIKKEALLQKQDSIAQHLLQKQDSLKQKTND